MIGKRSISERMKRILVNLNDVAMILPIAVTTRDGSWSWKPVRAVRGVLRVFTWQFFLKAYLTIHFSPEGARAFNAGW